MHISYVAPFKLQAVSPCFVHKGFYLDSIYGWQRMQLINRGQLTYDAHLAKTEVCEVQNNHNNLNAFHKITVRGSKQNLGKPTFAVHTHTHTHTHTKFAM
jgi:hypothetical protein